MGPADPSHEHGGGRCFSMIINDDELLL